MQKIELTPETECRLGEILKSFKTYKSFSSNKDKAYEFCSLLGLRACPYCNINHVYTVYRKLGLLRKPMLRPDIDHFIPKAINSALELESTNLVTCCQSCNSRIKLDKYFSSRTHIHPLELDFNGIKKFGIDLELTNYLNFSSFSLVFRDRVDAKGDDIIRANKSIVDLALEERYQYHKEDVVDLFKRAKYYHRCRLEEINSLVGESIRRKELFPDVTENINSKPLSKLTNDILSIILKKS